jgi:hypothetical protein
LPKDSTGDAAQFLSRLAWRPLVVEELAQLGDMLESRSTLIATPLPGLEDCALALHASYGIREIFTSVTWLKTERRTPFFAEFSMFRVG